MAWARYIVSGKVQGVWFRASTRDQAIALGLSGHARNLANGDVEVLASGDRGAIAQLERWLRHGPPLARVSTLHCMESSDADGSIDSTGFETG